jgi:hypothetical protein
MPVIKLSDIEKDKNWPYYWRRAYYEEVNGPITLVANASPGTLISTSYTLTLYENCYVRIFTKCVMHTTDNGWRNGYLGLFEGAGGISRKDYGCGSCHHNSDVPHLPSTASAVYDGYYTGALTGTNYVFEIRGWSTPDASDVLAYQMRWWIDVCRA